MSVNCEHLLITVECSLFHSSVTKLLPKIRTTSVIIGRRIVNHGATVIRTQFQMYKLRPASY